MVNQGVGALLILAFYSCAACACSGWSQSELTGLTVNPQSETRNTQKHLHFFFFFWCCYRSSIQFTFMAPIHNKVISGHFTREAHKVKYGLMRIRSSSVQFIKIPEFKIHIMSNQFNKGAKLNCPFNIYFGAISHPEHGAQVEVLWFV